MTASVKFWYKNCRKFSPEFPIFYHSMHVSGTTKKYIECYHPHLTSLVSISIPAFWLIRLLRRGDSPLAWTWTRLFSFFICLEAVDALVVFSITLLPTGVPGCPLVVCSKRSTTSSPFCPAWIFRLVFTAVVFAWKLNTKLEIIFFPSKSVFRKIVSFYVLHSEILAD